MLSQERGATGRSGGVIAGVAAWGGCQAARRRLKEGWSSRILPDGQATVRSGCRCPTDSCRGVQRIIERSSDRFAICDYSHGNLNALSVVVPGNMLFGTKAIPFPDSVRIRSRKAINSFLKSSTV